MQLANAPSIATAAVLAALSASAIAAAPVVFESRSAFASAAGPLLTDDYEDGRYQDFQTDAEMSSVKGWTQYETTSLPDMNEIILTPTGQHIYAGGFKVGSFQLDFTAISLGGSGVHAVGFDYVNNPTPSPYVAFVSYSDGTSENFPLQTAPFSSAQLPDFFGLTSSVAVTRVHIGLVNGGATSDNLFALDNLSVANPVPEPASFALLSLGLVALALARHRSRRPPVAADPSSRRSPHA